MHFSPGLICQKTASAAFAGMLVVGWEQLHSRPLGLLPHLPKISQCKHRLSGKPVRSSRSLPLLMLALLNILVRIRPFLAWRSLRVLLLAKMWGHCALVLVVVVVLDDGLGWGVLVAGLLLFCGGCLPVLVCCSLVACCVGCGFHWGGRPSRSSFILRVIMCMYMLSEAVAVHSVLAAGSSWLRVHT